MSKYMSFRRLRRAIMMECAYQMELTKYGLTENDINRATWLEEIAIGTTKPSAP